MAIRWSSEFFRAMEHRDLQASAMALDNSGTYVLLAGRRYIGIRNLDNTDSDTLKKFPRQSKYEVGAAEWNPSSYHKELCVISCNQKLEVLSWTSGELKQIHSLSSHTRVITDLNWHRFDPNLLASCSVDTFINIWDLRDFRRPTISLSAIAEANQVRWNRISANLIATAHEGDIKLWDQRKGTAPIQYIAAHISKIHGLDWNPNIETQLATSSQDGTVKFFDITNSRRAECVLTTNSPVWRARFTPFGNGLVTVVVPPQLRRGENSLLLWSTTNLSGPVHTFVGHTDVVLEFEWRKQQPGSQDYQLVTWSKDQTLRVWRIDPFLQKQCGHETEDGITDEVTELLQDAQCQDYSNNNKQETRAQPLQQEFSLLNKHIPNMEIVKFDAAKRTCTVTVSANHNFVVLLISFPPEYPHHVAPVFQLTQGTTVDENIASQLLQCLTLTAQQRVVKNRTCLELCLKQLVATLEQLTSDNALYYPSYPFLESSHLYSTFNDSYIPFPRTSGAKFCSVSMLVCFGRTGPSRRLSVKVETPTPRSLSSLGSTLSRSKDGSSSLMAFYSQRHSRSRNSRSRSQANKAMVTVYDASGLFFVSKILGEKYTLEGDLGSICRYNAAVASSLGKRHLVQAWTIADLVTRPYESQDKNELPDPIGKELLESLISHYASESDFQTAAMLSCIYDRHESIEQMRRKLSICSFKSGQFSSGKRWLKPGGSPYHTIPPTDNTIVEASSSFRPTRSNSVDNLRKEEEESEVHVSTAVLPTYQTKHSLYDHYKLMYADILYRWGLLYSRTEVLKYLCAPQEPHKGVEFLTDCQTCSGPVRGANCDVCKQLSLNCVICHISVRGSANFCLVCGHGGHTQHLLEWFNKYTDCPTGCGCQCLNETAAMLE